MGGVVSNVGTWMQRIAQDWLVLTLTDSPAAVGLTTAFQFLPTLLFGLHAGVLADRFPKRRILQTTQATMAVMAALLAWLTLSGAVPTAAAKARASEIAHNVKDVKSVNNQLTLASS